jgi:hypothetical protein
MRQAVVEWNLDSRSQPRVRQAAHEDGGSSREYGVALQGTPSLVSFGDRRKQT